MLSRISAKIANWLGEEGDFGVGQAGSNILKSARYFLKYHSLADLLIYEAYDAEYGVYINRQSLGFVLEVGLFIGSDSRLENELSGLYLGRKRPSFQKRDSCLYLLSTLSISFS
jgi:hypothetical protein